MTTKLEPRLMWRSENAACFELEQDRPHIFIMGTPDEMDAMIAEFLANPEASSWDAIKG